MTKRQADPPNLKEQQLDHVQRYDAIVRVKGIVKPAHRAQAPDSYAPFANVRDWLLSEKYHPDTAEIFIKAESRGGSLMTLHKSVDQARRATAKGPKYDPRNELLKSIARKFEEKNPDYPGNSNDAIRDHIIEALECLDRSTGESTLDVWFGDEEVYNEKALKLFRIRTTGEIISTKTIGNLLSKLK